MKVNTDNNSVEEFAKNHRLKKQKDGSYGNGWLCVYANGQVAAQWSDGANAFLRAMIEKGEIFDEPYVKSKKKSAKTKKAA
jgi:hypothetical protein